jgi:hypothetical protein
MASTITLFDGSSVEVNSVISGIDIINGFQRDFIEIEFDGDKVPYETVKEINDNTENLQLIEYTWEIEEDTISVFNYQGYTIQAGITTYSNPSSNTIKLKLGKPTFIEQKLVDINDDTTIQLAIAELASIIAASET